MEVQITEKSNYTVASLSGDLVEDAGDVFIKQLHPILSDKGTLLLDLSAPKYINSSGIALLVNLVGRANSSGSRVILVAPSPFVAGVLHRTKLDTFFEIAKDGKQAESLLNSNCKSKPGPPLAPPSEGGETVLGVWKK